nr:MAG TPA: hypothetical protein [Caudoviricetes sp.]
MVTTIFTNRCRYIRILNTMQIYKKSRLFSQTNGNELQKY